MENKFNLSEKEIQDLVDHGFATVNGAPLSTPVYQPRTTPEQILTNAIRHIQHLHMNCRTWTLPAGDDDAITLLRDIRATHRAYTPLCG